MTGFVERTSCPVCGDSHPVEYFSLPFGQGEVRDFLFNYYRLHELYSQAEWEAKVGETDYVLFECRACRALFQGNAPDTEFALEIYSRWIGRNRASGQPRYPFAEYTHWMSEAMTLTDVLLRQTGKSSPADLRVLDYGMGHGTFARAMAACGCDVFGYDFAVNRQKNAALGGVRTIAIEEVPAMRFDFINTEQVFEHLPEPGATGRLLAGALADGGVLKISVPFNRWLENGDRAIDWKAARYGRHSYMPLQPLEHLTYFRRSTLESLASQLGITRVNVSAGDILRYATKWTSPATAIRNVGRALFRDHVRNYHLFQKPAGSIVKSLH